MKFIFKTKKAALFGIDARIALVIYAIMTVLITVSAIKMFITVDSTKILSDISTISKGVRYYMRDMDKSIFATVDSGLTADEQELTAFQNLYSKTGVIPPYSKKWNGPYIRLPRDSNIAPLLEVPYRLVKRSNTLNTTCGAANTPCFVFLKLKGVATNYCDDLTNLTTHQKLTKISRVNVSGGCDLYIKLSADY